MRVAPVWAEQAFQLQWEYRRSAHPLTLASLRESTKMALSRAGATKIEGEGNNNVIITIMPTSTFIP